jgi:hypothetical protein
MHVALKLVQSLFIFEPDNPFVHSPVDISDGSFDYLSVFAEPWRDVAVVAHCPSLYYYRQ